MTPERERERRTRKKRSMGSGRRSSSSVESGWMSNSCSSASLTPAVKRLVSAKSNLLSSFENKRRNTPPTSRMSAAVRYWA